MAIDNAVALWNENAGSVYNAREYRRMLNRMMAFDVATSPGTGAGGIFRSGDLVVSAGGGQSVNVDVGGIFVRGSESTHQAGYFVYNDATVNVTLAAADATNPRIDIIGVQIRDSEYSGANNDARIVAVTGTPAGSPSEPSLPANFVTLARVDVPANDNTVNSGQITDRRRRMAMLGGIIPCTSTTRPTVNLFEGLWIYEVDTHEFKQYTTATTGWTPPWNMPWGHLTRTFTSGTGTIHDPFGTEAVAVLSSAVTVVANRLIHVWSKVSVETGADNYLQVIGRIRRGNGTGGSVLDETRVNLQEEFLGISTGLHVVPCTGVDIPGSGSLQFSVTVAMESNLGTVRHPSHVIVADIGKNGAPA